MSTAAAPSTAATKRPGIGIMPRIYAFAAGALVGVGYGYYRVYHEFSGAINDIELSVRQLRQDTVETQRELKKRIDSLH